MSLKAAQTIGTTANLIENQMVSIFDLLHGLMLPSGNDAGMTLAENFGKYLHQEIILKKPALANEPPKSSISMFVKRMNSMCHKLHLKSTCYTNPHGLADKANHSTAYELAQIANYAMKNPIFAKIVNTKEYKSTSSYLTRKKLMKLPNRDYSKYDIMEPEDVPFEVDNPNVEYVHFP